MIQTPRSLCSLWLGTDIWATEVELRLCFAARSAFGRPPCLCISRVLLWRRCWRIRIWSIRPNSTQVRMPRMYLPVQSWWGRWPAKCCLMLLFWLMIYVTYLHNYHIFGACIFICNISGSKQSVSWYFCVIQTNRCFDILSRWPPCGFRVGNLPDGPQGKCYWSWRRDEK